MNPLEEKILNCDDVLNMLDALLKEQSRFNWDSFYSDREKGIPFFVNLPDENLAQYFDAGILKPGKALELGCGPGRNALFLAKQGCAVDAVDLSEEALRWAKERATGQNLKVNFIRRNIFELEVEEGAYDIVYDSGCFHHIPPHRRMSYLQLLHRALKPNGSFAITCFRVNGKYGGSNLSDWDVYRLRSLKGGLGYTEARLQEIFRDFQAVELRPMRDMDVSEGVFGTSALLAGLFKRIDA